MVVVRPARPEDAAALRAIDTATWSPQVSPAPLPADSPFFNDRVDAHDVLVAEVDGEVAGYTTLAQHFGVPSHKHVLEVNGLAVDPRRQRRGVGKALVEAAVAEAHRRGARKLSLRVLEHNRAARLLYETCGFAVEGVLVDEFLLDGQYVGDVFMARRVD
jgi:ribosomal protein S18 acetylase RimI-like enzyme